MGSNVLNEIIFRNNFKQNEKQGVDIPETTDYIKHYKQQRKIHLYPIDLNGTPGVDLTPSQKFKIVLPVIGMFIFNLNKRLSAYELVNQQFGFLRK